MTTIAWDGEVLASDSREVTSCGIFADDTPKLFYFKGIGWAGTAGGSEEGEEFFDWVGSNFNKKQRPSFPKDNAGFHAIFIDEKTGNAFMYWRKCIPCPILPPKALGSGADFAMASMKIGFGAEDAVRHAIVCDHRSGGKVQTFRTKKRGHKD